MSYKKDRNDSDYKKRSTTNPQNHDKKSPSHETRPIPTSYAEIIDRVQNMTEGSSQLYEECFSLFAPLRNIKDLSNDQANRYFELVEGKLRHLWLPFLTKVTVDICKTKKENDSKFIYLIRTKCKTIFEKHGIMESTITNAEKNLCFVKDIKFVIQFLNETEKTSEQVEPIIHQDLACLTYICFSLFCRQNQQDADYIQSQLLIDRAIAEHFSSPDHTKTKVQDLVGVTLGHLLSGKSYSPKRISELTYLYAGTTDQIVNQADRIQFLDEVRKNQAEKIESLKNGIKIERERSQDLREQLDQLKQENEVLVNERVAAENMLSYEKNKFQKQLQSQEEGLAEQLSSMIALELEAMRDLVEYLGESDQRRFTRRLDRIERYLKEFGGEQ